MAVYTYAENINRETFTQIEFFLDTGQKAILIRGLAYELTDAEALRLRSHIRLNVGGSPVYTPSIVPNSAEVDAIIAQAVAQAIAALEGGIAIDISALESISVAAALRGDVIPQSSVGVWGSATRTLTTAARTWILRYSPTRAFIHTLARWDITTAATTDQTCELALYDASLATRIATSGVQAGQLNATGIKGVSFSATVDPSLVYYLAWTAPVSLLSGTGASVNARTANGVGNTLFGATVPTALAGFIDGLSSPLPTSITAASINWTALNTFPMIALREL